MYFFISSSAVTGIEDLGDYVVKINETDSTPITFNINPNTLFAGLSDQVQETKTFSAPEVSLQLQSLFS